MTKMPTDDFVAGWTIGTLVLSISLEFDTRWLFRIVFFVLIGVWLYRRRTIRKPGVEVGGDHG